MVIGLDISLNSTGIVIRDNDGSNARYISFMNRHLFTKSKEYDVDADTKELISRYPHLDIIYSDVKIFKGVILDYMYGTVKKAGDLNLWHRNQLAISNTIADMIAKCIQREIVKGYDDDDVIIEHYSHGSKGDATMQIIEFTRTVKNKLLDIGLYHEDIHIVPGPTLKMYAGSGNYDKWQMLEAYLERTDDELSKAIKANLEEFYSISNTKKRGERRDVKKPIDDIIDAWWLTDYLLSIK